MLLGGDAGAGASGLIRELSARARQAGWRVVVGHCLDFGDTALPYVAFSEAFGRLADEEPETARLLVEVHPAIARLLPEQRRLADPEPSERTARAALFDAVQGALAQLAAERRCCSSSRTCTGRTARHGELLTFLFTRPFVTPISVVASYRCATTSTAATRSRATLAEWGRLPAVHRLELGPLGDGAVRSLVGALHPEPLPEGELNAIVARSEGNPFFVEELVATAEVGGGPLPTGSPIDAGAPRSARRRQPSRRAGRVGGPGGRPTSCWPRGLPWTTRGSTGPSGRHGGERAGGGGPGRLRLRHALLAEAVYQDLCRGSGPGSTPPTPGRWRGGSRGDGRGARPPRPGRS